MESNPTVRALLECLLKETNSLLDKFETISPSFLMNSINFKSSEIITSTPNPSLDLGDSYEPPDQNTHQDINLDKTDNSLILADNFDTKSHPKEATLEKQENEPSSKMDNRDVHFYEAYLAWRTAAGVVLCTPMFRTFLCRHEIMKQAVRLLKLLAMHILTDNIIG